MNEQASAARDAALTFIRSINAGVLATAGHDNLPHATVIHFVCDDTFNIFFVTKKESRKYKAIQAHPQVAFVVGSVEIPRSLQIEGVASEVVHDDAKQVHATELMNVLATHVPGYVPVGKMDGELALMWIQPKVVRWSDFSKPAVGIENLQTEIPVV